MYVKDVTVQNQVGLHARPATFFIQKANEFKSSIWVEKEERRVNAKSLLGVLSLGIMGGTDIRIIGQRFRLSDGNRKCNYCIHYGYRIHQRGQKGIFGACGSGDSVSSRRYRCG